jgi:chromo domain-containing protein 1
MGRVAFRKFIVKNKADFEAAILREETAKEIRIEKREKRRRKLRKRARSVIAVDESDSDESLPLISQFRASRPKVRSPRQALADREAIDSSQLNSLFVDEHEPPSPASAPLSRSANSSPHVRQSPLVRKPPLQQSESSSEDDEMEKEVATSGHALSEKLKASAKESQREASAERQLQQEVVSKPGSSVVSAAASLEPKLSVTSTDARTEQEKQPTRLPQPPAPSITSKRQESSLQPETEVRNHLQHSTGRGLTEKNSSAFQQRSEAQKPSQGPSTAPPTQGGPRTEPPKGPSMAKRSQPARTPAVGVKFINEAKSQSRKPWENSDRLYNKLKFRGIAEKRSRVEGAPDFEALDFVGAAPAGLVKSKVQDPHDNPYGRREVKTRRLQDDPPAFTSRRESTDDVRPLADWEAEKVPLVCPQWRLSNNCQYGERRCHFMHRSKDALGRDLPLGDLSGYIPPKYRKPPITCPYWLENKQGCMKTPSECDYAHRNTGVKPHPETWRNAPIPIDINQKPASESAVPVRKQLKPVNEQGIVPTVKFTCWFWAKKTCRNTPEQCPFEHWHTGVLAPSPNTNAAKTCWFWTVGKCNKPPGECSFMHYDTGTIADPPPSALTCRKWTQNICTLNKCKFQHWCTGVLSGSSQQELSMLCDVHVSYSTNSNQGLPLLALPMDSQRTTRILRPMPRLMQRRVMSIILSRPMNPLSILRGFLR